MVFPTAWKWEDKVFKPIAIKRGCDVSKINDVIAKFANGEELPAANHDHPLTGKWANHRECHIAPDWLLIYQIHENVLVLELTRTGLPHL